MTEPVSNRAYLSLGSNIEPATNLQAAVRLLNDYGTVRAVSTVWESPPFGFADQPPFLNAALLLETPLSAGELKETAIVGIERLLGRIRSENRNGPRTIDIDIMLFNEDVLSIGNRRIPDPEVLERAYVAVPLAEIAPDYRHPVTGETLAQIAARFGASDDMQRRTDVVLKSPEPEPKNEPE